MQNSPFASPRQWSKTPSKSNLLEKAKTPSKSELDQRDADRQRKMQERKEQKEREAQRKKEEKEKHAEEIRQKRMEVEAQKKHKATEKVNKYREPIRNGGLLLLIAPIYSEADS